MAGHAKGQKRGCKCLRPGRLRGAIKRQQTQSGRNRNKSRNKPLFWIRRVAGLSERDRTQQKGATNGHGTYPSRKEYGRGGPQDECIGSHIRHPLSAARATRVQIRQAVRDRDAARQRWRDLPMVENHRLQRQLIDSMGSRFGIDPEEKIVCSAKANRDFVFRRVG
jgi:hypothetical protein